VVRNPVPLDVDGQPGDDRVPPRSEQHERAHAVRREWRRPTQVIEPEERLRDRAPARDAAQLQEPDLSALRVRAVDIALRERSAPGSTFSPDCLRVTTAPARWVAVYNSRGRQIGRVKLGQ
jgi:hypothetical protein